MDALAPTTLDFDDAFPAIHFSSSDESASHLIGPRSITRPDDADAREVAFRHSGWAGNRRRVRAALCRCEVGSARLDRFDRCGSNAWVLRSAEDPDVLKVASSHCRDRFCVPCATARSNRVARNLTEAASHRTCRFVTLTLKTCGEPLAESLNRLYKAFSRLRRTRLWLSTVSGGVACLEIKWCSESLRWHPHLHLVVTGKYLPQAALSAAWLKVTGDSFVVDVRYVTSASAVGSYVCKYASKPLSGTFLAVDERLDEAIRALRGRRMVLPFGDWLHLNLMAVAEAPDWLPVSPLWRVLASAQAGDPEAVELLARLEESIPCQARSP